LERAGIKAQRLELFVGNAARQPIRIHDLRGTFVTLALANGRPESWVMAGTGHRSSQMVLPLPTQRHELRRAQPW